MELDWTVDWSQRIIRGKATLHLRARSSSSSVDKVVLDTSYLAIKTCSLVENDKDLAFSIPPKRQHPVLGSALTISLPAPLQKGETVAISIEYATTDECTALGWLNAEQTDSKRYPFMYSQCQAIHARSLLPCMDTPAIKASYVARVKSTLPVLLSAQRTVPPLEDGVPEIDGTEHEYVWEQKIKIPSYLIAIAGGELAFRPLGKRTGIWAEPGKVDACAYEFEQDAERMVSTAEQLCGPYRWGRYDALVLPASFPYGGMENPCLTFLTPALIVGDRSQVDVVAHEASHSWHVSFESPSFSRKRSVGTRSGTIFLTCIVGCAACHRVMTSHATAGLRSGSTRDGPPTPNASSRSSCTDRPRAISSTSRGTRP